MIEEDRVTERDTRMDRLGICCWCGVLAPMTKDHIKTKPERKEWYDLGWQKRHFPYLLACERCNHKRGDKNINLWREFLLTNEGWWYTALCHFSNGKSLKATEKCWDGKHFCAAWKPCHMLDTWYVGNGYDVIASYIYQEPLYAPMQYRSGS